MITQRGSYVLTGPDSATAGAICGAICEVLPSAEMVSKFLLSSAVDTTGMPDFFVVRMAHDVELTHHMAGPLTGEDMHALATAIALLLAGEA
jgi:hypothetical protein